MAIGLIVALLILLMLYCCIVQGKKGDEVIDKLYLEIQEKTPGKDSE